MIREAAPAPSPLTPGRQAIAVGLIILVHLSLCLLSLKDESPTIDEFAHLPAGAYYWKTGDFTLYGKNPPLVKLWCGWPLLAAGARVRTEPNFARAGDWRPWLYGTRFMRDNPVRYHDLFVIGRLPNLILSAALGLVVFFWSRALFGPAGGLISLGCWALSPNIMAHARLVTMDVGLCLFFTLTLYLTWRFLKRPGPTRAVLLGLSLGLANLTKYTALLLLPILPLLFLVQVLAAPADKRGTLFKHGLAGLIGAYLLSLLVLNAGYGFRNTPTDLRKMPAASAFFQSLAASPAGAWSWPAPRDYLSGLDRQKKDTETGVFPNYLEGRFNQEGWWYYYTLAWVLKTPPAFQLLLLLSLAAALYPFRGRSRADLAYLALPLAVLWIILSFFNRIDAGVRYFLPAWPLLFVYAGSLAAVRIGRPRTRQAVAALLFAAWLIESLWVFPNYLAYFNPLYVKPSQARFHLLDSNLDWGQDLKRLKTYMDRRGIDRITLAYFGHADPALYGIDYRPAGAGPVDGPLAVSANLVMGLPYLLTYLDPPVWIAPDTFAWLRDRTPSARVGGSILIYD
ncbi:MAG: glycosyltransferase family 39 protein [Proteobacteria bacterium]|nr:glycosyltransferase family 39 protein [Pseudomonadota bacterium]